MNKKTQEYRGYIDDLTDYPPDDATFARMCVEIAREQNLVPEPPLGTGLSAIEPVAEGAFKLMTIANFPPSEAEAEFLTSGTTMGSRGRRFVQSMGRYRQAALAGFDHFCMYDPVPKRFCSLIPRGEIRPNSSLSWMISFVLDVFGAEDSVVIRDGETLDFINFTAWAARAVRDDAPVFILGTTLDFHTLFAGMKNGVEPLPTGSRAMHTGGAKATGRQVDRNVLRAEFLNKLGILSDDVIEEYGMSELMSQAYDSPRITPGRRRLMAVPWMRTRVLDPMTMTDVAEGQRGQLCHYDLASSDSAVALLTSDIATSVGGGFVDIERTLAGGPRGCSEDAAVRTK